MNIRENLLACKHKAKNKLINEQMESDSIHDTESKTLNTGNTIYTKQNR